MAFCAGIVLSMSFAACGEGDKDTGSNEVEVLDTGSSDTSAPSEAQDTGVAEDTGAADDTGEVVQEDTSTPTDTGRDSGE